MNAEPPSKASGLLGTITPRARPDTQLQLWRCTPSDRDSIRALFLASFGDVVTRTVFPSDVPAVQEWWAQTLDEELREAGSQFLKVVAIAPTESQAADSRAEQVIAFAKWNLPDDAKGLDDEDPDLPAWPKLGGDREKLAKQVADSFFRGLARGHLKTVKDEVGQGSPGHWYLEMLGTLPEWRGLGAAGMLVKWGLNQADTERRVAYVESSPGAADLYRKFGFEDRGRVEVKQEVVAYYNILMIRRPQQVA